MSDPLDLAAQQLKSEFQQAREASQPSVSDFERAAKQLRAEQDAARLRQAATQAEGVNPDHAAKAQRMARESGLPTGVVERNPDEVDKRLRMRALDQLAYDENMAAFFSDPENFKVASDDINILRDMSDVARSLPAGAVKGAGSMLTGAGELWEAMGRTILRPGDMALGALGLGKVEDYSPRMPWWLAMGEILKRPGNVAKQVGKDIAAPVERQNLATDVSEGVGQLAAQIAAMMVTGGTIGTGMLFAQGADQQAEKQQKAGAAGTAQGDAAIFAGGAVTALTERYGLDIIMRKMPEAARSSILKKIQDVLLTSGAEAAQELTEGILQNVVEYAFYNPQAEIFEDFTREMAAAGGASAIVRTIILSASGGKAAARGRQQTERAQQDAEALKTINQLAEQSKLRERAPDKFRAFVAGLIEQDRAVELDAQTATTLFQEVPDLAQFMTPAEVERLTQAIAVAQQTGADVRMPLATFVKAFVGTQSFDELAENVRMVEDAPTAREAAQWSEAEAMDQLNRLRDEVGEVVSKQDQIQNIYDDVFAQLKAAAVDDVAATKYAAIVTARLRTRAERLGRDPGELWMEQRPLIRRQMDMQGQAFDELDVTLDDLRSKQKITERAAYGDSLIEFLAGRGGLIDAGGELKAMDADKWHRERRGRRKLVAEGDGGPTGPGLMGMAGGEKNRLSLDEAARAAWEAGYFPEMTDRPTPDDLLAAIERELKGSTVYAPRNRNDALAGRMEAAQQLDEVMQRLGLDPATATPAEIREAVDRYAREEATAPEAEGDGRTLEQPENQSAEQGADQPATQARGGDVTSPQAQKTGKQAAPGVSVTVGVEQAAALDGEATRISKSQAWATGRDLKVAFQEAVQKAAAAAGVDLTSDSPETMDYLVRMTVRDAVEAFKTNANAVGWYDLKTRQALSVMSLVHPEIATDELARFRFTWALAVTSNGLKVDKNFELAEQVYRRMKEGGAATGEMPTDIEAGNAQAAINNSLALFNQLQKEWGIENLRQFMLTDFTVSEITAIDKDLSPTGEFSSETVRGAAILGPKIGNGFFSNLYGFFDALTMDRWLVRSWGRWTGTLIQVDEQGAAKGRDRLRAAIGSLDLDVFSRELRRITRKGAKGQDLEIKPTQRERMIAALEVRARGEAVTDADLDAVAEAVANGSATPQFRALMDRVSDDGGAAASAWVAAYNEGLARFAGAKQPDIKATKYANDAVPAPAGSAGKDLRNAANNLAKYLDGQKEQPDGPAERQKIRAVFRRALAELQTRSEFQSLNMSDLQALLWYAEKRLYETAKEDIVPVEQPDAKGGKDKGKVEPVDIKGYDDDEAPDYANAAAKVARDRGVSERRIRAALDKEEQNGRAAAARPGNGGLQAGAGQPPAAGGFTGSEKRRFVGDVAARRVRSDRSRNAQSSGAYQGKGRKDGRGVRLLKPKGLDVTAVEQWSPGRYLKQVFRSNGLAVPDFYELAPGDEKNAQAFAAAITASKERMGAVGAAVFVYDPADYAGMRLFLSEDGKSGVAVKPDGDIVSVFGGGGTGRAIIELAVAAGGRKLDAFETILPEFYAAHGFRAVARLPWDDSQAPAGWDKTEFAEFNSGEPDVVFMVYDPSYTGRHSPRDGIRLKGKGNYDRAVRVQSREAAAVAARAPRTLNQPERTPRQGGRFSAVERALEDLAADIDGIRDGVFDEVMARKALDRLSDRDREDPRARLLDRALLWLDGTIELDQDAVADEIDQVLTRARQIDEMMAGMRSAADTGRTVEQPALPDTLDIDGVARPTTNSKGQPIAQTEEGVRAFWRWFGDSKVVDAEGRPLVVYRGQRRVAKPERFIMTRGRATPSFVEDPQVASVYSRQLDTLQFGAGSNVMPVYLRIVSMLDMRKSGRETTLEGVLHGLNYDWSVEYGRSREGSKQTDGNVSFEEFKAARRQASIGYGDLADALRDLDELIYKTGANYEIEASDGQGFRIKSFSDLADQIEQMGADGDTTGIDIAISEAVIDAYTVADSEAFVDLLTRLGFDGIIVSDVFDAGARFYEGDAALIEGDEDGQATVSTYRPFGQNQIKSATGNRGTFDTDRPSILEQVEGKMPRGSIKFLPGGRSIITLTEKADLSTFLHELSHGWLEEMKADAQAPGAPADIRADWERIAKYLEIDPEIDEIPTEAHETFARTGEAYFMEGKAPSTDLAGAFARFKAWLVRIYRTIRELRVPINDDIRGVFDRMLATDEEIATVRGQYRFDALFDAPAAQGMTKAEFRAYRDLAAKAQLEAEAEVAAALQADAEREQTEQYREAREAIANEVEAQVRAEPVQRAIVFLRDGTLPDGTKTDAPIKLARGPLRETYGRKAVKRLPKGVTADDGVPADMVATLFGFQSGDELVKALMTAPPVEGEIRRRLEARLREQFPDARKDGRAHEAAIEAMHGDARMRVLEAEFRALKRLGAGEIVEAAVRRKMAGKAAPTEADVTDQATTQAESEAIRMEPGVGPEGRADAAMGRARTAATRTVAKQQRTDQAAARKIAVDTLSVDREAIERAVDAINGETKVSDMLNAQRWRRAEKAAADAVVDAVASRNWGAAAWHQRQRIIAAHMVRRSAQARNDVEKAIERFNKYLSRKPGAIDPDYLEKVRAILQAYQFGPQLSDRRRAILEMRQIARWQAALAEDEQARLEIAPEILAADEKTHYRDMTLDEFMALRDTVENLATIGRTKTRLLRNQAERDLNRTAELVSETILANVKTKARRSREAIEKGVGYGIEKFKDQFFASHRKIENLVRELDGFANLGPVWQALFKPLQDAQNEETRMSIEAAAAIKKLFERFPEDGRRTWRTRTTYYPSVNQSLSKATVISIALNWGNEGNREAIRKGFRWSDQQVQELFDAALTAEDAAFVQSVWDYIDTFWPALSALEKRVKGISPAKVEASPLQIAGVDLSGGYYPLKYDPDLSERAYAHQVDKLAQNLMSGAVAKASTRTGAAIERVGSGGMPVRLELDVMFEHVAELIHDISHREAILDVARLLDHPSVKGAVLDTKGPQFHRAMKDWVRDVAAGDVPALTWFDKIVQHLRSGMSIAAMGWKLTTAMVQPTGFFQSAAALPKGVLGKHVAAFYGAPLAMRQKVGFVYERSVEMRTRSQSLDRDIRDTLRRLGPEGKVDAVKRSFFYLTGMMDMGVAIPTWLAAYEVGMEQFAGDEAQAIDYADQLVRTTQSSGLQKDLAAIQRGDPRMKMFTAFYSYFSATYNLMADNVRQVRRPADMPRFVANMVLLTLLPAVASELMMGRGPGDDDREEPLGWAKWMAATTLKYALSGFVGVRDIVNALGSNFGYAGSPVGSAVEQFVQLGKEIGQGEADRGLAKAAVNAAGPILHLPSRQAWITAEGIYLWAEGADITPFEMFVTRDPAKFR